MVFRKLFSRHREPTEQAFWRWFAENSATYLQFEPGSPHQNTALNQLENQLSRVHRDLRFEIGMQPEGAVRELVISADGHRELFPAVQTLVAAAPSLPEWKFTAFRQRHRLNDVTLHIEGADYGADQLWFKLRPEGDVLGVDLYMQRVSEPTSQSALMVCFLMLDIALGEYDVETKVGTINPQTAPEHPTSEGLKPFGTFPEEFDALYALMHGRR